MYIIVEGMGFLMKRARGDDYMCINCENALNTGDGKTCLCSRRGVVRVDGFCRHFTYDPLKRKAKPIPDLPELEYDLSDIL